MHGVVCGKWKEVDVVEKQNYRKRKRKKKRKVIMITIVKECGAKTRREEDGQCVRGRCIQSNPGCG